MARFRRLGGVASGAAAVVTVLGATVFNVAFFGLLVGGLAYKKECATNRGTVRTDWTFQWWPPIPYLFRPGESGCIVHTGTRVALNAVGIAEYPKATLTSIARDAAEKTGDKSAAYYVQIREATREYMNRNKASQSVSDAEKSIDGYLDVLRELEPPPQYPSPHRKLIDELTDARSRADGIRSAIEADDQAAMRRMMPAFRRQAREIAKALREIERIRAAE